MINQYGYNSLIVGLCMVNIIALLTEARPGKSPFTDMEGQNPKLCQPDRLTVYRVTLNTFWNPRNFPKHYPQWRPPAQWSKLVGGSICTDKFVLTIPRIDLFRNILFICYRLVDKIY